MQSPQSATLLNLHISEQDFLKIDHCALSCRIGWLDINAIWPRMLQILDWVLTLSGTRKGIFTPLSLLDQILSADFFFKNSQTLLEVKIEINPVILTPCQAH